MYFRHSSEIWHDFPDLVAGAVLAGPVGDKPGVDERLAPFYARASARLDGGTESELVEVQAWRRAFSKMGLKPTQYRSASEALLRRFRREGALPRLHGVIDLCNAASLAFAIPLAVFDVARISGHLEVRYASGDEVYRSFSGELETPAPGEVIFADDAGQAHARRWTNRQSSASAVTSATETVLVIAEALHPSAPEDVAQLTRLICLELERSWGAKARAQLLTAAAPRFDL